jgi:hypothetical protein
VVGKAFFADLKILIGHWWLLNRRYAARALRAVLSTCIALKVPGEIAIKVNCGGLVFSGHQWRKFKCLDKPSAQPDDGNPKGGAGYENKKRPLRSACVQLSKTLRHLFYPASPQHPAIQDALADPK